MSEPETVVNFRVSPRGSFVALKRAGVDLAYVMMKPVEQERIDAAAKALHAAAVDWAMNGCPDPSSRVGTIGGVTVFHNAPEPTLQTEGIPIAKLPNEPYPRVLGNVDSGLLIQLRPNGPLALATSRGLNVLPVTGDDVRGQV